MLRKDPLVADEVYHIFNRSIARFIIFNEQREYVRMLETIRYYQQENPKVRFSRFIQSEKYEEMKTIKEKARLSGERLVEIIAFCLMPTHLHLVLKQLKKDGISIFMGKIQNSYTKYFNLRHKRNGPLWESRFKNVLVEGDEQLLHLTRYVHLNPVTANLVKKSQDWLASSYQEYSGGHSSVPMCDFQDFLEMKPKDYQRFVEEGISYQKELAEIKHLTFD